MTNIFVADNFLNHFKSFLASDEEIIYGCMCKIAKGVKHVKIWESPVVITRKSILFFEPLKLNKGDGNKRISLYDIYNIGKKFIYVSWWNFRPLYSPPFETKEEFKFRQKNFLKTLLPYVLDALKDHLAFLEVNRDNPEIYNKKLEKRLIKKVPKYESKLKSLN